MWNTEPRHAPSSVYGRVSAQEPLSGAEAETRKEQKLRECIRRHKVFWKAWPEFAVWGSERRQVGFRLGLFGTHDRPSKSPIAGCPECWKVYRCLHDLALWLLPTEEEESELHISVYDASLIYNGERREILVTIEITHRNGFDSSACEARCLADIEKTLLRLGAPQDQWKEQGVLQ
jgi:hypothetical protein